MGAARQPSFLITAMAVGFLALDGVLLLAAALWSGRAGLYFWSLVFLVGAAFVMRYYRRYLKHIDDLSVARAEMKVQIEMMRRDINKRAPTLDE